MRRLFGKKVTTFTSDEVGRMVLVVSRLDPDNYDQDEIKSIIHKARTLVKPTGPDRFWVERFDITG